MVYKCFYRFIIWLLSIEINVCRYWARNPAKPVCIFLEGIDIKSTDIHILHRYVCRHFGFVWRKAFFSSAKQNCWTSLLSSVASVFIWLARYFRTRWHFYGSEIFQYIIAAAKNSSMLTKMHVLDTLNNSQVKHGCVIWGSDDSYLVYPLGAW